MSTAAERSRRHRDRKRRHEEIEAGAPRHTWRDGKLIELSAGLSQRWKMHHVVLRPEIDFSGLRPRGWNDE